MEFQLNEEQLAIKAMVRKFARDYVKPIATKLDEIPDPKDSFPWEMYRTGCKLGLKCVGLPEEYGGNSEDLTTQMVIAQEIGHMDVVCAKIFTILWRNSRALYLHGTEDQRQRFLTKYRDNVDYIIAGGLTEAEAGSDNILPYTGADGGLRLTAVRKGDGYILNGTKHFTSLGYVATDFLIAARTDKTVAGYKGSAMFIVPGNSPGFSVGHVHNKFGLRAYGQAELVLDNVYVPKENLLGKENTDAGSILVEGWGNLELSIHNLSLMEIAFDTAFEYAKTRIQGGKPIIEHQAVATTLADMYTHIEASRGILLRILQAESQKKSDRKLAIIAKLFTSEAAVKVTRDAMEMFGGSGVMKELPLQKYLRDALTLTHLDGTLMINKIKLANLLKAEEVPPGTGLGSGITAEGNS
jgi:alkylation response protein AidB-like acyl-CoA dehydrogenase